MCTEALVNGEWCENLGELEKAIGGACVGDYGEHRSPESCLCPVDWQATAAAHGLIAREGRNELAGHVILHAPRRPQKEIAARL
jgi:hypothetical protein